MRIRALLAVSLAAVLFSACATATRYDAAGDVHALLVSIRNNDHAAFDARVDRPALKSQIESQLVRKARDSTKGGGWQAAAIALAGPVADIAGDALVQPETFRYAANYYGYTPDKPIPDRISIAAGLRYIGSDQVCAAKTKDGPCLLTFTLESGTWRLSGFDPEAAKLRLKL
jgi:ABC-type amino acid transport substrate-binding protein